MKRKMWAIVGNIGIYNGTYSTRVNAIASHVWALDKICHHSRVSLSETALNSDQIRAWERCKRNGDKAVKVTVTVDD